MKAVQKIRAAWKAAYEAAVAAGEKPTMDADGREIVDPTPIEVPVALARRHLSVNEQIRQGAAVARNHARARGAR